MAYPSRTTSLTRIDALGDIGAALSIPSSLALIVRFFPEPREQSIAIALFGGVGALGNGARPLVQRRLRS